MLNNTLILKKYLSQIDQKLYHFELIKKSYTKEQLEADKILQIKLDQIYESGIVF